MRKLFFIPVIALAAVAFAAGPATASAPAATTCQAQFDVLRDDTNAVDITARDPERERSGLLRLIGDAESLVARGKTSDAATKLRNFQVKVDQLEAAGRITNASAGQLRGDAEAAIACLQFSSG
jgi:hypothetical protein